MDIEGYLTQVATYKPAIYYKSSGYLDEVWNKRKI
jgi:hypothetical protein